LNDLPSRRNTETKKKTSNLAVAALPIIVVVVVVVAAYATHLLRLLETRTEQEAHDLARNEERGTVFI